jgi:hypothetical protein
MEDEYEPPFTAADHTKLVRAVLEHPLHVIKYLDVPRGQSPTTLQVIDAALQVRSFDSGTKARLQESRAAYLRFEEEQAQDSASFTERRDRVHAALEGKSIPEMIAAVDDLLKQEHLDDRSARGLELAKEILVDGADSIYSPDFSAWELLEGAPSASGRIRSLGAAAAHRTGAHIVAEGDAFAASTCSGDLCGAAAGGFSIGVAVGIIYNAFFG